MYCKNNVLQHKTDLQNGDFCKQGKFETYSSRVIKQMHTAAHNACFTSVNNGLHLNKMMITFQQLMSSFCSIAEMCKCNE